MERAPTRCAHSASMLQDENETSGRPLLEDGVCVLDRFAEQVAGRRGVAWSLIIATRGKEEACFAFRRVNYGRRGSVARRAERKHDLSLRVVRDTGHEREASGRDGTKDRRARRHAVGGTDRATSPCTKEERQE